ncbi:polymorphic toxin type 15 domain-containing protein, partial [Solibacillus ferritrahens]|uniref:polymorphic toxin type 15 domain-containing protein n=1 Tax=Solibacillus ferritrahens TaxID=3098620 RepID=UPI00300B0DCE
FIPVVGNAKALVEAVIGRDPITGRKLESWERGASVAAILGGPLVKGVKHGGKAVAGIISGGQKATNKTVNLAKSPTPTNPTKQQAPSQAKSEVSATTASPAKSKGQGKGENSQPPQNGSNIKPAKLPEIEVKFNYNPKHDSAEFRRQLKAQEEGMNELTVDEYLKNREKYIAEGRAKEGNVAQQTAREEALSDKITEFMDKGKSFDEAEKEAGKWLKTQAALHNPDQVAGGRPEIIGGMGDKRVKFSIGSQWKSRIKIVDKQIEEKVKNMTLEQLKNTYLNVKLTH